jgi:hypothetical protein
MMASNIKSTKQALNPAFLKQKPERKEIELFKKEFIALLDRINLKESEEFHKNLVTDFLNSVYYKDNHYINTKGYTDLVIHNGKTPDSSVAVLIEVKSPVNKTEMVTLENWNVKSFRELVLYYLRERKTGKNFELRYLIITNIYEWFIFDAQDFEKLFYQNKTLLDHFEQFQGGKLSGTGTDFFYKEIASPEIQKLQPEISCTHFDIRDYDKILRNTDKDDDRKLIALYKFLSPVHLLKLPFASDNNQLNREFYTELLHIIGLEEIKQDNRKMIVRKREKERDSGSIIENAIEQIDVKSKLDNLDVESFGKTKEEQLFSVALDLAITWINRILFLKLLESQIVKYHDGNRDYAFLSSDKLIDYKDLDTLFFSVLARREEERKEGINAKFLHVPYLNSSLFEITEMEGKTICMDSLQNNIRIAPYPKSVLQGKGNSYECREMKPLEYLLRFLDAYDFSSEGSEEIQEENKPLISASVLGLIFEKINGYKDGSFFTPSFITMYMCRETIRQAVIQKFNEVKDWSCRTVNELYNKIEDIAEANVIFNSIRICDPAVGSGHFLVSSLNEMIFLKSELGILIDKKGKRLKDYRVTVENDELIITDNEGNYFIYNPKNAESQRVQEALFNEKQTIIEDCLFGVDINPNSVKICQLRLWIELLKHTYYHTGTNELETLPNIDINIKCGNSLLSRFDLQDKFTGTPGLEVKVKQTTQRYKEQTFIYKSTCNKETKKQILKIVEETKRFFLKLNDVKDKDYIALREAQSKLLEQTQGGSFSIFQTEAWQQKNEILTAKVVELENKYKEKIESCFEWRYEFPEVLDDNGNFTGFDVVIGNPPYMRVQSIRESYPKLADKYEELYKSATGSYDIYAFFVEKSLSLIKEGGIINFIMPVKWTNATFGKGLRTVLTQNQASRKIINFGSYQVFEASTYTGLHWFQKATETLYYFELDKEFKTNEELGKYLETITENNFHKIPANYLTTDTWTLSNEKIMSVLDKLNRQPRRLSDIFDKIFQGLATSKDDVYFLYDCTNDDDYVTGYSKQINEIIKIEKGLTKPLLKGEDVHRYETIKTNRVVIFPYKLANNEANLYTEDEIKDNFPLGYSYLKRNETVLRAREKGTFLSYEKLPPFEISGAINFSTSAISPCFLPNWNHCPSKLNLPFSRALKTVSFLFKYE